jgi:hypothetical protein
VTEDFPELDPLVQALTADATAAELAGEQAAAAMFSAQFAGAGRRGSRRRFVPPAGLTTAAAVAVLAALTGGAYAAVLPASMQHIAHHVLARIGVPDVRPPGSPAGPAPLADGSSAAPRPGRPVPSAAATPAQRLPGPAPARPPLTGRSLLLSVAHARIAAGSAATLDGQLVLGGLRRAGVPVRLLDLAGSGWRTAGTALTGGNGEVAFTVRHVTRNTLFRLSAQDTAPSPPVLVTVSPRLTVTLSGSLITVSARYAEPGDMVLLQIAASGTWRSGTVRRLGSGCQASFTVAAAVDQYYRVVLLATGVHGAAVSRAVHPR